MCHSVDGRFSLVLWEHNFVLVNVHLAAGKELAIGNGGGPASAAVLGGFELMLPGADGQGAKILGTREFARYYRQKQRPVDTRQSVTVNTVLAK